MKTASEEKKTKKLSFQASRVLLKMFEDRISNLPISRDLFLQNVIKTECEFLAKDLNGKRLSAKARTAVARCLREMKNGTKQVSVVIDPDVAARLDEIVRKHNIGGCKNFCVNGHSVGNYRHFVRRGNDRSKSPTRRADRQPAI